MASSAVIPILLIFLLSCYRGLSSHGTPCEAEAHENWKIGKRLSLIQSGFISQSIENGWWSLASEVIRFAQVEGLDIASEVRNSIASVQRQVTELARLLEQPPDEIQTLSPALQWAESIDKVFVQIKLAYRWSSPGALVVEGQNVTILPNRIFFSGIGTHSNIVKNYKLNITLYSNIIPEESDYSWGAVGKMIMTLKKATPGVWSSLLDETEKKISNAHIWWEMKEKLELQELQAIEEAKKGTQSRAVTNRTTAPSEDAEKANKTTTNSTTLPSKSVDKKEEL